MKNIKHCLIGLSLLCANLAESSYAKEPEKAVQQKYYIEHPESFFQPEPERIAISETPKKDYVDNPEFYVVDKGISEKGKVDLGNQIIGLMKNECDYANFYFMNNEGRKDLVIECYKKEDNMNRCQWSVNIDTVCRAYVSSRKKYLGLSSEKWLITKLSDGSMTSKKMSYESANEIARILTDYLNKHNSDRCEEWNWFIQQNYGVSPDVEK